MLYRHWHGQLLPAVLEAKLQRRQRSPEPRAGGSHGEMASLWAQVSTSPPPHASQEFSQVQEVRLGKVRELAHTAHH